MLFRSERRLGILVEGGVAGLALGFEFGVLGRQRARRNELLYDRLRPCGGRGNGHRGNHENGEPPETRRHAVTSVQMNRDHMDDRGEDKKNDQRQMQHMPKREQAFVDGKRASTAQGPEIARETFSQLGMSDGDRMALRPMTGDPRASQVGSQNGAFRAPCSHAEP